ncbi:hypothetical protein M407DRAFT_27445 [Tulasnella calospora MUT 4182]|uniref:Uncharacterized protein n=1 Tax=Tulasnella calospora MUT 4182 TaxID=1051891 RepID=A0A0C3KNS8_9AGAM|nr:hypothetical protein M407DRAFT_27445 [Tulasnella calospora MUT 4182]
MASNPGARYIKSEEENDISVFLQDNLDNQGGGSLIEEILAEEAETEEANERRFVPNPNSGTSLDLGFKATSNWLKLLKMKTPTDARVATSSSSLQIGEPRFKTTDG